MPLQKILLKAGVNREKPRYAAEGVWYESDKVRFRQSLPEKIGGWERISATTFQGVCRSLWNWITLGSLNYIGVGTNLKFYVELGGAYNDITPIRTTTSAGAVTFSATDGSSVITVTNTSHGAIADDFVTFSGAASLGGNITAEVLNQEYQIATVTGANTYTITAKDISGAAVTANASDSSNGGGATVGAYQINTGFAYSIPLTGWGAGTWGAGTWGIGGVSSNAIRLWSQQNFGEDLVFGPRNGAIFYWDATNSSSRAVLLSSLGGASDVPIQQHVLLVSDINRFVFCFGPDDIGT